MQPVNNIGAAKSTSPLSNVKPSKETDGAKNNLFEHLLDKTNEKQQASDTAVKDLVQGKTDNVHQVVMAVTEAELSFQLFMEIRNHLIDSYNELMRMQF